MGAVCASLGETAQSPVMVPGEIAGKNGKTSFSPSWVFLFSRNLTKRFWRVNFLASLDWEGMSTLPCPAYWWFHI